MATICALNNDAVALVRQGHHGLAAAKLRQALQSVRTLIGCDVDAQPESRVTTQRTASVRSVDLCGSTGWVGDMNASPHNIFHFYNKVFEVIPHCSDDSNEESPEMMLSVSAALMFNMAHTFHTIGLMKGEKSCLIRALRLYEFVAVLFDGSPSRRPLQGDVSLKILLMGAYNNAAHIHSHLMEQKEAFGFQQNMRVVLGASPPVLAHLSEDELFVFYFNAMMPDATSLVSPAA